MDVESLAKQLILQNMTPEQQNAVLESVRSSLLEARNNQKRRVSENVGMVVEALKKIEADIRAKYDDLGGKIETRVNSIKDGRDGIDGRDGKDGKDGRPGRDGAAGAMGPAGQDGVNGLDGEDGVSVTDAKIDFDGSLVITLSNGREINVGEVVAPDLAERIKVITNGGGTSQTVIDALASLQAQIDALAVLDYKGTWNASTNTPTLASGVGDPGSYYIVSVAGTTNLNGITDWQLGDWAIFNGSVWQKIDQSNLVTSVNGQTGAVSLTTTDISEGTNQYYLDSRARSAISAGTGISYNSSTGVVTNSAPDQTVALTAGTGISTSGTYPNFTITNSAPDQVVGLTAGTGISTSGTYPNFTITNAAPDQTVGLTAGTGISTSGTYPNFTITNSAPDQTVALTAGTGISTSGTYPNFTITNSAPDQTVSLTGAGTTSITGTYPNFTVTSNDQYVGTVTSVTGTSPVASSGGATPAISLASGYGDTQNPYASKTANFVLAAPNGSAGAPTFRAIVAADIPTLNQNTTGTASNVTGTVAIANGGTGQTAQTAAFDALSPATTKGDLIVHDGTNDVRLPVGTNNFVLTADSTQASGLKWAASAGGGGFAAGTAMMFVQTSAPTGWTKSTTHDNKALRVVSGTASSGGSVAFTTAFASQSVSGTVGATTLATTQIASHVHLVYGIIGAAGGSGTRALASASGSNVNSASAGGGSSHDHGFTGTAINLAVQYVDVIIATKD